MLESIHFWEIGNFENVGKYGHLKSRRSIFQETCCFSKILNMGSTSTHKDEMTFGAMGSISFWKYEMDLFESSKRRNFETLILWRNQEILKRKSRTEETKKLWNQDLFLFYFKGIPATSLPPSPPTPPGLPPPHPGAKGLPFVFPGLRTIWANPPHGECNNVRHVGVPMAAPTQK